MKNVIYMVIQLVALLIFGYGFFGDNRSSKNNIVPINNSTSTASVFDRMVFILIDALRYDFVYDQDKFPNSFTFLRERINDGSAIPFIAMAEAPTVTLPRLKALTSGQSPKFFDLINNLIDQPSSANNNESSSLLMDSWVKKLNENGTPLLHFGDDTWIRLFPNILHSQSQGIHSLFATDTVECDRNVTEHVSNLLQEDSVTWPRALSLHYLGIDHVGHVGGIHSPLMIPKMKELDKVIGRIYEKIKQVDLADGGKTFMVVLGDHGMTDGGNHGGSSPDEINTACIFLSPLYRGRGGEVERIDQKDIATTISMLLGLDIPRESIGSFLHQTIPNSTSSTIKIALMRESCLHLRRILGQQSKSREECPFDEGLLVSANKVLSQQAMEQFSVKEYRLNWMIFSIQVIFTTLLLFNTSVSYLYLLVIFTLQLLAEFIYPYSSLVITASIVTFALTRRINPPTANLSVPLILMFTIYAILMFSSAFVEEEHEIWYFLLPTFLLLELFSAGGGSAVVSKSAVLLFGGRLLRYWNSTGYANRNEPDIAFWIKQDFLSSTQILIYSLAVTAVGVAILRQSRSLLCKTVLTPLLLVFSILYKLDKLSIGMQQVALITSIMIILIEKASTASIAKSLTLLLKTHNAIPILLIAFMTEASQSLSLPIRLSLLHASYFALGPCHLIPSIDFSPAFIGQSQCNPLITGILGFATVWAGPLIAMGSLHKKDADSLFIWRSIVMLAVTICILIHRNHLFVWTVFAPRFIFEFGWTILYIFIQFLHK